MKPCKCDTARLPTKFRGSIVGWRCPRCRAEWPCDPKHPGNWIKAKEISAAIATTQPKIATVKASKDLKKISPAVPSRVMLDAWLLAEARAAREQIQGNAAKPYKWTGHV